MLGGGMGAAEIDYFRLQTVYEVFPAYWRVNGGGDWRSPANWLFGSFPDTIGISVSLGEFATSDATIFIDDDVTIGRLTFQNDHKYAIAGAGVLVFDRDPFIQPWPAGIEVLRGAHELQVSMALNAPLEINASSGTRLDLNNRLTLNGHPLTVTGAGIVSFNNEVVADGGSVINNGVLAGSATIFGSLVNAAGATLRPGNSPGAARQRLVHSRSRRQARNRTRRRRLRPLRRAERQRNPVGRRRARRDVDRRLRAPGRRRLRHP